MSTAEVTALKLDLVADGAIITSSSGISKPISYPDLVKIISQSVPALAAAESSTGQTFCWPRNTYLTSISKSSVDVAMYFPSCVRDVNYGGNVRPSILPNIVIRVRVERTSGDFWSVGEAFYYCTDQPLQAMGEDLPTRNTPRFGILPFTNIYDTGALCYGENVRVAKVKPFNLKPLIWYYEILFTSPFNNDLGVKALSSNSQYRGNPASWYKRLAHEATLPNPSFPYSELHGF